MSATITVGAEVYATALAAHDAGLCVLPVKQDGTKAPDVSSWTSRQTTRSSQDEIAHWFGSGSRSGLGYVTGAVSGNLELLDFDDVETYEEYCDLAVLSGLGPLLDRVRDGYLETSPGGVHLLYRCPEIAGNTKLARRTDDAGVIHVLIETRGNGGFVVVAPSNGRVHPSGGAYQLVRGGVATIATIGTAERAELHALARSLDTMPKDPPRGQAGAPGGEGRGKPGDDYNQRGDVLKLLSDRGWMTVFERAGTTHLRRPGKDLGTSATFATINGKRYFYPFTTSTAFESERAYSPFGVYATLEHNGDFTAAAQALAEQGYGEPPQADHLNAGTLGHGQSEIVSDGSGEPWGELQELPPRTPVAPTMPSWMIPEPMREWLVDSASRNHVPLEMPAVAALIAAGGLIGNTIGIRPGLFDDFTAVPNLWGAVVARPGWMKSESYREPFRPVRKLIAKAQEEHKAARTVQEGKAARVRAELKAIERRMALAARGETTSRKAAGNA